MLPQNSIVDLVGMAGHIDEQAIKSVVTRHESGLDTISAPAEPSDADRVPGSTVAELLRVAKRHYDFVVLDTPPAFTSHVLAGFDDSDLLILIATLDIPAVKNLRLTLDTLDLLGNPRETRLVVLNRSDAKVGLRAEDVVSALKQDIAVMVPSSTAVPASVNRGVPIVLDEPKHPVSQALRDLAERYVRVAQNGDAGVQATQPAQRRRSLLSRGGSR
jgi:pilus assembly protein CpaE